MKYKYLSTIILLSALFIGGYQSTPMHTVHAALTTSQVNQSGSQAALRQQSVAQAIKQSGPNNPLIFSHRGSMLSHPQHSFAGYDAAIDAGSAFIEQDVWLSKDNQLYVSHDNNLTKTTGKNVTITNATAAQLNRVPLRNGERLHSLAALFQRYGNRVHYVIEAKHDTDAQDAKTQTVMLALIKKYKMTANVIIQNTSLSGLQQVHKTAGFTQVPTLWLAHGANPAQLMRSLKQAPSWLTYFAFPAWNQTKPLMNAIRARHIRPAIWTISTTARIKQAAKFKPDAVFTNLTAETLQALSHPRR